MQKKYVKFNVLMALALLFAIGYQSLHIFTDEAHHFCDEVTQENTSKTHLSADNHNYCPVCDYEFAAFLAEAIFTYDFINPNHTFHYSSVYESFVKENEFLYFSYRGPPVV
ncbi:hypothetical protein [Flavobacterium sp.]|jgi:hypothetical protein|uniref:hypothetical protein n=1 Tax=Flavobacterium sp. TaxID=239 RepID=UPI0037BFC072